MPRIFAYLFDRIKDANSRQVNHNKMAYCFTSRLGLSLQSHSDLANTFSWSG